MSKEQRETFEGWCVLELMGHRRLGGYVMETTIGGGSFLRIDVPGKEYGAVVATQFYSPSAVYCITPTTELMAKVVAIQNHPDLVSEWELKRSGLLKAPEQDATSQGEVADDAAPSDLPLECPNCQSDTDPDDWEDGRYCCYCGYELPEQHQPF